MAAEHAQSMLVLLAAWSMSRTAHEQPCSSVACMRLTQWPPANGIRLLTVNACLLNGWISRATAAGTGYLPVLLTKLPACPNPLSLWISSEKHHSSPEPAQCVCAGTGCAWPSDLPLDWAAPLVGLAALLVMVPVWLECRLRGLSMKVGCPMEALSRFHVLPWGSTCSVLSAHALQGCSCRVGRCVGTGSSSGTGAGRRSESAAVWTWCALLSMETGCTHPPRGRYDHTDRQVYVMRVDQTCSHQRSGLRREYGHHASLCTQLLQWSAWLSWPCCPPAVTPVKPANAPCTALCARICAHSSRQPARLTPPLHAAEVCHRELPLHASRPPSPSPCSRCGPQRWWGWSG